MRSDFITCPACNTPEGFDLVTGECHTCGCEPGVARNEPGCPRCFNTTIYDSEAGVCYNCGYEGSEDAYEPIQDGPPPCLYCGEREEPYHFCKPILSADGEELLSDPDVVESFDIVRESSNVIGFNRMTPAGWAKNTMNPKSYTYAAYQAPEPYQPFFDLIEDLKEWHVKVEKTSDKGRLHTWVNKMGSKGAGVDVTNMAKAFGPYVWIPTVQWGTKIGYLSLVHEATHAKDFWKFGTILFFLMQNLLPFGPSFVALFEYRAYVAGLKAEKEVFGYLLPKATQRVAEALASRGYRYCFPFPKLMKRLLDRAVGEKP
jgi:hypothetical protein